MLVAVISDIHDHLGLLRTALERIQATGVEALICCGDLCSPFVVAELARGFPTGQIAIVFGNNDGDRYRITTAALQHPDAAGAPRVGVLGESATLELGGKRIFVHHFPDVGAAIAAGGQFDAVCYGHDHEWAVQRHPDGSLAINPGAIMGWHPRRGDIASTYALYDTESGAVSIVETVFGDVLTTVS
jgi:putative phosphoesterase